MLRWLTTPSNGKVHPNTYLDQYSNGQLTQAPIDPHPVTSAVVYRESGSQADRESRARAPPRQHVRRSVGVPLVPWLDTVFKAQEEIRQNQFTPVPSYVRQNTDREAYLKMGDALAKHHRMNSQSVESAIVNSQTLGLGNNRR